MGWIPCSERLPAYHDTVLVAGGGSVWEALYLADSHISLTWDPELSGVDITH